MAEKTEKATPKKLRDARKKGQVAKVQDFPSAFTFVVSIMGTLLTAGYLYQNLTGYTLHAFRAIRGNLDLSTQGGAYIAEALQVIMIASFPIVVIVAIVGVLVNFLVIGPVFSFEAMKFQWKKLNPIEGIKQKFKLKVLIELLKSILKIIGAALIIFLVIWNTLPDVVGSVRMPIYASVLLLEIFLRKVTIQVGIFFLAIAIFDLAFQKRTFAKEMMMEKFEVKQEYKDTEGDPHIKGKRREIFREIAYSEGPKAARRAKVIVTNPTHLAIALAYSEESKEVPIILTMGQRSIAEKIIEIAISEHIPIMRNVALAHELFNKGKIGDYIPEETYRAVAEILKWIATLEEKPSFAEELYR